MSISSDSEEYNCWSANVLLAGRSSMRITSNLLGEIGRAIRRAVSGVHETDLVIPPVVQPTISGRNVAQLAGVATVVNETSFIINGNTTVTNNVSAGTTIGQFNAGLWEIDLCVTYASNYSTFQASGGFISFVQGGLSIPIISMFCGPAGGGQQTMQFKFTVNVDTSTNLQITLNANGVGQTHSMAVGMIAHRLL